MASQITKPLLFFLFLLISLGYFAVIQTFTVRFCDPYDIGEPLVVLDTKGMKQVTVQNNGTINIDSTFLPYPYTAGFTNPLVAALNQLGASPSIVIPMPSDLPGSTYIWYQPQISASGSYVLNRAYIRDYNSGSNDCNSPVFTGVRNNSALIVPVPYQPPPHATNGVSPISTGP